MGGAIAAAVAGQGRELLLCNSTPDKARALADKLGAQVGENPQAARECQLIFLGVKPQMMGGMLEHIAPVLAAREDRFVLVTMAAGLTCQRIREMAGGEYPVIRIMPNTPCAIGAGVVQVCGLGVSEEEFQEFEALMAPAGLIDRVEEKLIDAASAVSGCGPAFAYLFMEALADGAVACGLPRDKALAYAAQMVAGSAEMVLRSGKHPGVLKDAVCSPGGSTIQGVRALEERGFRAAAMNAVIAAYEKTLELK
jgi:pyrroline-5-carboxylate reductase